MIKEIKPESYLPQGFQPDPKMVPQAWFPHEGDKIHFRDKSYVVVDTDTELGGSRTIAIVRIYKTRYRIFPWAYMHFIRDVDFHKLCLLTSHVQPTDNGSSA